MKNKDRIDIELKSLWWMRIFVYAKREVPDITLVAHKKSKCLFMMTFIPCHARLEHMRTKRKMSRNNIWNARENRRNIIIIRTMHTQKHIQDYGEEKDPVLSV